MYEEVVDQINKKLALKQAIERANEAIAKSRKATPMTGDDQASSFSHMPRSTAGMKLDEMNYDSRSRASKGSKLSLIALSQKGKHTSRQLK